MFASKTIYLDGDAQLRALTCEASNDEELNESDFAGQHYWTFRWIVYSTMTIDTVVRDELFLLIEFSE